MEMSNNENPWFKRILCTYTVLFSSATLIRWKYYFNFKRFLSRADKIVTIALLNILKKKI